MKFRKKFGAHSGSPSGGVNTIFEGKGKITESLIARL